jgi:cation-transporting ATPase 13A2
MPVAVSHDINFDPRLDCSFLLIVPSDFDELLRHYTHRGYRVIACAAKYENRLSWMKIQKMSREQAETNLEFLGFIIFENKLKETTTTVIDELKRAGIRNVMCTGDNILTAISVARECGLINRNSPCFVPHFSDCQSSLLDLKCCINRSTAQTIGATATLVWESIDDSSERLDEKSLLASRNDTTRANFVLDSD